MRRQRLGQPELLLPALSIALTCTAFMALPLYAGVTLQSFDVYNALQGFARLGLISLALGLTMMIGEFDLSVVGVYALGGMLAVQHGSNDPVQGIMIAVGVGATIGLVQGCAIAGFNAPSMPITLATYIALLGVTNSLSGGLSETYDNIDATLWVDHPIATVLTPRSLITLGLFLAAALVLTYTKWGREMRAIGGDRVASRVAGVRVNGLIIGVFVVSGALSALGGALLGYSLGSTNPDPGVQPLILGAAGALLGGVALAGGRGNPLGLLAGSAAVALLGQIVIASAVPGYATQLFYAGLLAVIVLVDAPDLRRGLTRFRARHRNGRAITNAPPGSKVVSEVQQLEEETLFKAIPITASHHDESMRFQ